MLPAWLQQQHSAVSCIRATASLCRSPLTIYSTWMMTRLLQFQFIRLGAPQDWSFPHAVLSVIGTLACGNSSNVHLETTAAIPEDKAPAGLKVLAELNFVQQWHIWSFSFIHDETNVGTIGGLPLAHVDFAWISLGHLHFSTWLSSLHIQQSCAVKERPQGFSELPSACFWGRADE